jgi:hypothetical protein
MSARAKSQAAAMRPEPTGEVRAEGRPFGHPQARARRSNQCQSVA